MHDERLDGDRSRAAGRARARSRRATSACCSAASTRASFDGPTIDVTRPYVQALEARGLPHLLVGGKSFHEREEVETLRTALAAIEWPDDELSVFGTLRGALFAFGDDVLLGLPARAPERFHPFRRVSRRCSGRCSGRLPMLMQWQILRSAERRTAAALLEVAAALRLLRELHLRRNQRPVAETIAALLDASRAHAIFALRPSGEQALANVQYVGELARQYEAGGGLSFRGFVERLRDEAEETRGRRSADPRGGQRRRPADDGAQGQGPRVPGRRARRHRRRAVARHARRAGSTASGARCAVSLAGWAPAELRQHAPIEVARDEAEGVRVAYVAATRARDLLVVCAVGDVPVRRRAG